MNDVFPDDSFLFPGTGHTLSGIPRSPCGPPSRPYDQESRSPPRRVAHLLRDWLPTRAKGPSDVDSPVRLGQRRTLTRPVRPRWALMPTSESLHSLRHFPRFGHHCWQSSLMKHRGHFYGPTRRLNPLAILQYSTRYCYRMYNQGFKCASPCDECSSSPSPPFEWRPGSPEPADELTIPGHE